MSQPEPDVAARSRTRGRVMLLALAGALVAAWVVGLGLPPLNLNAEANELPSINSPSDLVRTSTYKQVELVMREHVGLRRLAIPAVGEFGYAVAQRSMRGAVWQGKNGELFFADDFTLPCKHDADFGWLRSGLTRLSPKHSGLIKFIAVANKSTTMRDELSAAFGPSQIAGLTKCADKSIDGLRELQRDFPRMFRYLQPSYAQAARWQQPLYYTGDTHWSPATSTLFSMLVASWVTGGKVSASYVDSHLVQGVSDETRGDLFREIGLSRAETLPLIDLRLPKVGPTVEVLNPNPKLPTERQWTTVNAPIKGRTLIIRDSFFTGAIPATVPLFESVNVAPYHDIRQILATHSKQFDRIIVEIVERNAPSAMALIAIERRAVLNMLTPEAVRAARPPRVSPAK